MRIAGSCLSRREKNANNKQATTQWVPQICKFHSRQKNKQPVTLSQDANAARAPCCLHESKVANECFISSELSSGIEVSVRPILLILLHESGLSPLKTLGTTSSVQIINMHGNQYLFGREERMFEEELTERVEASSGVLIHYIHLFSFYPPSATHVHICTMSGPENMSRSAYISFCYFSPVPVDLCSVYVQV